MSTKIKIRRDTKANWESINPVLAEGELALEKDTGIIRCGDGVSRYLDLPIANISSYGVYSKTEPIFTGKTWIDGKPIYRIVADMSNVIICDRQYRTYYTHNYNGNANVANFNPIQLTGAQVLFGNSQNYSTDVNDNNWRRNYNVGINSSGAYISGGWGSNLYSTTRTVFIIFEFTRNI